MTDSLNSRIKALSETPSICCVNLTAQLRLQTQKLDFVHWRLSQHVLSQSCRAGDSVLLVYGWMSVCHAHIVMSLKQVHLSQRATFSCASA